MHLPVLGRLGQLLASGVRWTSGGGSRVGGRSGEGSLADEPRLPDRRLHGLPLAVDLRAAGHHLRRQRDELRGWTISWSAASSV